MRVDVHEAGRGDEALGVQFAQGLAGGWDEAAVADAEVTAVGGSARPVHDQRVPDPVVERRGVGGTFLAAGGAEEAGGEGAGELAAAGRRGSGFRQVVEGILADACPWALKMSHFFGVSGPGRRNLKSTASSVDGGRSSGHQETRTSTQLGDTNIYALVFPDGRSVSGDTHFAQLGDIHFYAPRVANRGGVSGRGAARRRELRSISEAGGLEAPVDNAELRSISGAGGWKLRSITRSSGRYPRPAAGSSGR